MSFLTTLASHVRCQGPQLLRLMSPLKHHSFAETLSSFGPFLLSCRSIPAQHSLSQYSTGAALMENSSQSPSLGLAGGGDEGGEGGGGEGRGGGTEIERDLTTSADSADIVPGISTERPDDNVPKTLRARKWKWWSRRTGLVGIKLGMTQLWNREGFPIAVTVLQMLDNQVVMVRTKQNEGHFALQIGAHDNPKLKNVPRQMMGQFKKAGVPPKRRLTEFKVTPDGLLPVGTKLYAAHFYPGQYVDVCSKSIGKGFQGVMKRHGMKGQPASHGVTKTHRKMGATGGGQDPGRIWPGKKMPGRMGAKRVTMQNLKVYRVNNRFGVIYVHGPVPGHKNTYVRVSDAKRRHHKTPPPFPTYIPDPDKTLPEEVYSDDIHLPHEGTVEFEDKRKEKRKR